jgi:hypothetical protein
MCLRKKNVLGSTLITLGGLLGCIVKYPYHTIRRAFGKTKNFKGEKMQIESEKLLSAYEKKETPSINNDVKNDLESIVDDVLKEATAQKMGENDYKEIIAKLEAKVEECKKNGTHFSPKLDNTLMLIEILKTLNDQNIERFNYHEKTIKMMIEMLDNQSKIDKKYTGKAITFIVVTTIISTVVLWENKELIISVLEPVWKIVEPFIKVTKGD